MHLETVNYDTFHFEVLPFQVAVGQSFSDVKEKSQFLVLNNAEGLKFFWSWCTKSILSAASATTCVQFMNDFDKQSIFIDLLIFDFVAVLWVFFTMLSPLKHLWDFQDWICCLTHHPYIPEILKAELPLFQSNLFS